MRRRREKQKNIRFELDDLELAGIGRATANGDWREDGAGAALPGPNAQPFSATAKSEKEPTFATRGVWYRRAANLVRVTRTFVKR